jgi:hypothetical protein
MARSDKRAGRQLFPRLRERLAGILLVLLTATAPPALSRGEPDAGSATPAKYYAEDIKEAMLAYIASEEDGDRIFRLKDDRSGEILELTFVKIHDPVRRIDATTYFACTDFHVKGEPKKLYDLDFWLRPENGRLVVYDSKVHKEPRRSLIYGWYKQPRYTFVNDRVVELY